MASNSGVSEPPRRRIVLLTKVKSTMRLGSTTLAFFRKGEDLEATQFKNLPHDDPALVPPKLGFRSFDRVPRHRAPLVIALLATAATAVCIVGWPQVRGEGSRAAAVLRVKATGQWVRLKEFVASRRDAR